MLKIKLGDVLGLRPLDRLQINDKHEINEMLMAPQLGYGHCELPFLYFQRVREDGRLEVRSPGGYATSVLPEDICDIVPGKPLLVRAMPEKVTLSRLRLSLAERQQRPGPECYAEAYVLHVWKDKWGRVDQTFVWFIDPALNGERPKNASIHDDDRKRVADHARRTNMPVVSKHGGNHSADHGLAHERDLSRAVVSRFVKAALRGNRGDIERLTTAGINKISRVMLNKMSNGLDVCDGFGVKDWTAKGLKAHSM